MLVAMKSNIRKREMGFTLIELIVVIFIIGILSAVAIPLMRGRTDATKWAEGKSMAGSIHASARAYIAEMGNSYNYVGTSFSQLGFAVGDFNGRYFKDGDFSIRFTNGTIPNEPPTYLITVVTNPANSPEAPTTPVRVTLDQDGTFIEYES